MKLVLFDLDGTLLDGDSDHAFGEFMVTLNWVDTRDWRSRNDGFYQQYLRGELDVHAYVEFATSAWRERDPDEVERARTRFLDEVIAPMIRPSASALVDKHRQAGDRLAVVTATNDFITAPIAARFGIEDLIATRLARDAQGRVTGAIEGVPAFREGKTERVQQWLSASGSRMTDFDTVTFYSDSANDLPLLEFVTDPVATNPDARLAAIARERQWRTLNLFT